MNTARVETGGLQAPRLLYPRIVREGNEVYFRASFDGRDRESAPLTRDQAIEMVTALIKWITR